MVKNSLLIAAVAVALAISGRVRASDSVAVMQFVPAEAHAAIIIPHLKSVSDQITQCLQGMDRANLLLGSRPLDRLKAVSGFTAGVNDAGSMAIALMKSPDGPSARLFIVPVTDAETFLRSNFTHIEGDAYTLPSGKTAHTRSLGSHVAISDNPWAIQRLGAHAAAGSALVLDTKSQAIASQGDLFIVIKKELVAGAIAYLHAEANARHFPSSLAEIPLTVAGDIETIVLSLDFDPLALVVRSYTKMAPQSIAARFLGEGKPADPIPRLQRLPSKPFYIAGAFHVRGIGDPDAFAAIWREAGFTLPPALLTKVDQLEFAAYPSAAGVAGGLLNDALAILRTPTPDQVVTDIRDWLVTLPSDTAPLPEVRWTNDGPVGDAVTASKYEVRMLNAPSESLHYQLAEQLLVGRAGYRGFIKQRAEDVVVTFSQRPATLKAAMDVAAVSADRSTLADQSVLRSMRRWLPRTTVIEAYINPGLLSEFMKAVANAAPLGSIDLPRLDPSLPPIAIGGGPDAGGAEHTIVLPAGVLASFADFAMAQLNSRTVPAEEDE